MNKLLASCDNNISKMEDLINRFYYSSNYYLVENNGIYEIKNKIKKDLKLKTRVILRGNRLRFELMED